ncbi:MAG: hypothetical protein J3K34DRAFT_518000 [Monoraphidium minutum]|nr:MAG: hypothetical protein J3K34DRAFT_518000 [Monoraphidium minutum]
MESSDASTSTHKQLQDAVCERLTKTGALDSIRRKVAGQLKKDGAFDARLQELLSERLRRGDLGGLEGKPKGARKNKVEAIKAEIIKELRGQAQFVLWRALAGEGSEVAAEVELRVLEALCSLSEEEQRQATEARERQRQQRREEKKRRREELLKRLQAHQHQQQQAHQQHPQQQPHPHPQQHAPQQQHQQQHEPAPYGQMAPRGMGRGYGCV